MAFEIIPLGSASAVPTRERHLSSTALLRNGRLFLFDCGEGTQFQLIRADLNRSHLDAVFITHLHGDHFFGLFGLLATLGMLGRTRPLTVVSPPGLRAMVDAVPHEEEGDAGFEVNWVEVTPPAELTEVYATAEMQVWACGLEHRVPVIGYRFQERPRPGALQPDKAAQLGITDPHQFKALKEGRSVQTREGRVVRPEQVLGPRRNGCTFAYVTDTRPCAGGQLLMAGADLVQHDATFLHERQERAIATGHSTALEAAQAAARAGARRLLLGHFSARYKDVDPLEQEARRLMPATDAVEELKHYRVEPELARETA